MIETMKKVNSYHSYHYILPIIILFLTTKDFAGVWGSNLGYMND